MLDLDHVGAEQRELVGAIRPGQHVGQVEDAYAGQQPGRRGSSPQASPGTCSGPRTRRCDEAVEARREQRDQRQRQQRQRQRVRVEHRPVAVGDGHGAAELRFGQRPEDHADDDRRGREIEAPHQEADRAQNVEQHQVDRRLRDAVAADGREDQDAGIELRRRDLQQPHPQADQRQVEHDQDDVGDEQAGDQAPDQVRLRGQEQRPRLDAVALEGRQHDRGRRRGRQAERQHRHQHAGRRRVVGGFRAGHALDRAGRAELLLVLRQLLLQRIGEEGRDLRAARRQRADREADERAAHPGLPRAPPFLRRHVERALERHDLVLAGIAARGDVERLADGEEPDRDDDDADAVEQFGERRR